MANPFDTLRKILNNEAARGYDNKGIIGGLDKYVPLLQQQAQAAGAEPAVVADVVDRLQRYPGLPGSDRAAAIAELLTRLPASMPAAPRPPVTPPSVTQPPEPVERPPQRPTPTPSPSGEAAEAASPRPAPASPPPTPPRPQPPQRPPEPSRPSPSDSHPPKRQEQPYRSAPPRRAAVGLAKRQPLPPEPAGIGPDAPLTVLHGVGPKQAENLQRLGLSSMRDALTFFPRRYVDYSHLKPINRLEYGEEVTIIATVWETVVRRIRSGQAQIVQSILSDGTGNIEVSWFGQPWVAERLTAGKQVQVAGKVDEYLGRITLRNPEWEDLDAESLKTGRIVPVYPLTEGVSADRLRRWMYEAVGYTAPHMPDALPQPVRERAALLPYGEALLQIHFPDTQESLAAARKRLAFDELLLLQLGLRRQRAEWQSVAGQALVVSDEALATALSGLPYALTEAQTRALADIRADLARPTPMNRLLQGDVGSGKTVVAALAMLAAVEGGAQSALMAPTTILAEQHYRNVTGLLKRDDAALLLGSTPEAEKATIYAGLRDGSIKMVIGTQAIIQERVEFANLGLVVVDEQHRFGVAQRARLRGKGANPHVLVMTATPIPRTLALTLYGDLDLSILDEMPPGRQPIDTRVLFVNERERAYAFLRQQIQQGRQAFVICPLVEESDKIEAKAAVDEQARLQKQVFPDLRLGLLHGRMKADEKEEAMRAFRDGETHILVSTSVVEVGVDVPNASTMLVEGANRFGLAQLHQFRGRVGRGTHRSYCLLASDLGPGLKAEENERLKAMEQTQDGFVLAEKDLELRGPGQFLGTQQAGFGALRMAKLTRLAVPLIDLARREAETVFAADPQLQAPEHGLLAENLAAFWNAVEGAGDVS